MMDDLISRTWLLSEYDKRHKGPPGGARKLIEEAPSAQPKKGKWISADAMFGGVPFYCSECGENTRDTVMGKPRWKFCPMCGSYNGGENEI
jgi:hypothetical protein